MPASSQQPPESHKPVCCVVVVGPTATGKTRLAVRLARAFGGEIVSADSRQVYRGLDIGTGKDHTEYGTGDGRVPVHMIDVVDVTDPYNVHRYAREARAALDAIRGRNRLPIVAGGSHLYIDALIRNYALEGGGRDPGLRRRYAGRTNEELADELRSLDPHVYARTDICHRTRILRGLEIAINPQSSHPTPSLELDPLLLAPFFPRAEIYARIERRLRERLDQGMVQEVRDLHACGVSWERLEFLGLEYRFAAQHLQNRLDRSQFFDGLLRAIRRFAKAQEIWLRKLERQGWDIHWIPRGAPDEARQLTRRFLDRKPLPKPAIRLNDHLYGPRTQ